MKQITVALMVLALMLAVGSSQVLAMSDDEQHLKEYVEENTFKLAEKLEDIRGEYQDDREAFYRAMDEALEDFVAFRRIAARIMGQAAREASPEQRDQFVEQFKRSLYDAYAGAVIETGDFSLDVRSVAINPRNENRATVNLRITTEAGNRYGVAYSMFRSEGEPWQMENVIVEGINIGLAFRDRFQQDMERHDQNVGKVIDNWTVDVGDVEGLDEAVEEPTGEADAN